MQICFNIFLTCLQLLADNFRINFINQCVVNLMSYVIVNFSCDMLNTIRTNQDLSFHVTVDSSNK